MPRLVHALLQDAIEGPSEHFLQIVDTAKKYMATCDFACLLGKVTYERDQGTLPNTTFAADKSYFEIALSAGFDHTVQTLDFFDAADEEINGDGLSRSERARLRIHLSWVSLANETMTRSYDTFNPEG